MNNFVLISFIVIIFILIIGLVGSFIFFSRRLQKTDDKATIDYLKSDITELSKAVGDLSRAMGEKLEKNSSAMQISVQKQLSESSKLVSDVTQKLTKLDETNRRVVGVADELKTLQNVLQNPKQRGVFGEFYLESVLDNVLAPTQFQTQYKFKDGEIVDAAVFLDRGKILPIDSKFSLENYNRMIEAKTKEEREVFLGRIKTDLKGRIDETAKYIRPAENTMDFAFMFIPSEALYYDLLINNVGQSGSSRDLIEYAFRDKRVIIVSPTSFLAYLQTVLQGLRSLQIEEQAKDIQKSVGKLSAHIGTFDDLMQRMGKSLSTTVNHYNNSYKELGKIDKDVVSIARVAPAAAPEPIGRPKLGE